MTTQQSIIYLTDAEFKQALAVLNAMLGRDVSKPPTETYREVKDAIVEHFANTHLEFTIVHRLGIANYTYSITHHGSTYVLRRGQDLIAEAGLIDRLITQLFVDWNGS